MLATSSRMTVDNVSLRADQRVEDVQRRQGHQQRQVEQERDLDHARHNLEHAGASHPEQGEGAHAGPVNHSQDDDAGGEPPCRDLDAPRAESRHAGQLAMEKPIQVLEPSEWPVSSPVPIRLYQQPSLEALTSDGNQNEKFTLCDKVGDVK